MYTITLTQGAQRHHWVLGSGWTPRLEEATQWLTEEDAMPELAHVQTQYELHNMWGDLALEQTHG